jgi:carboxylesterase type B
MQTFAIFLPFWLWVTAGRVIPEDKVVPQPPTVTLPGKSKVSGVTDQNYSSVRQFLGIPYAQPPVGELRWEAPQANQLPQSINATSLGRSCTQFDVTTPNLFSKDVLEFNVGNINGTGEDCLTLSVWTPENAEDLPVIVFFYGGGWTTGGQDIQYQIPTQWVQRTKDLIVVVPK